MLGAEGVLVGTRFLATPEAPLPQAYKEAICTSDGHDTILTEIPDTAASQVWPGAYARALRTRIIEEFIGRDEEVRRRRTEIIDRMRRARIQGDVENGSLLIGQDAGLIDTIEPAAEIVQRLAREAEQLLSERTAAVLPRVARA
jgi:NAD(P)H-dependent flavin oxidoreductase YrpB (nitropropane dioxygenase family)